MNEQSDLVTLATELTAAWLANSNTRADVSDVPAFLTSIHATLASLESGATQAQETEAQPEEYTPAVSVRKSLASKDHIISMIDGKPYKTLRRHLSGHGLTPEQYRERYNLKSDYPLVAENYSQSRRDMAKRIGLGRKPKAEAQAPKRGGARKNASEAKAEPQQHLGGNDAS